MKKCPYCAEEIQNEAIVCRYCGHDLKLAEVQPVEKQTSLQVPASKQGAKVAAIISALYLITIPVRSQNPAEWMGSLIFGLPVTFLAWWLSFTFLIWLWRQDAGKPILAGLLILGIVGAMMLANNNSSSQLVPPTSTFTPRPKPTSTTHGFIFGNTASPTPAISCLRWDEINVAMEGRDVCVYGTVTDYDENWEYQMTNIYFGDREKFFLVSNFRWDSSMEGQCILADGEVQLNTYKTPYIKIDEIYRCE